MPSSQNFRRARTRTLIQLGGLFEKAGLLNEMEVILGKDLQKDLDMQKPVATLMGALCEIKQILNNQDRKAQIIIWAEKGKTKLAEKKNE